MRRDLRLCVYVCVSTCPPHPTLPSPVGGSYQDVCEPLWSMNRRGFFLNMWLRWRRGDLRGGGQPYPSSPPPSSSFSVPLWGVLSRRQTPSVHCCTSFSPSSSPSLPFLGEKEDFFFGTVRTWKHTFKPSFLFIYEKSWADLCNLSISSCVSVECVSCSLSVSQCCNGVCVCVCICVSSVITYYGRVLFL